MSAVELLQYCRAIERRVRMPGKSTKNQKDSKRKREYAAFESKCTYGLCSNVGERFEKLGRIGEGTYGIVYKARDRKTRGIVALKRCLPHHESSDGFPLTTLREISTLRLAKAHPNIVRLHEVAVSSSRSGVFLVFEHCPHDLAKIVDHHYKLRRKSPFNDAQVKKLMQQLVSALQFLHARKILHRDLKLSNLLYSDNGDLKVADFGLSRRCLPPLTPKVVSLWYRPPELLLGATEYDASVDMWGAGCIFAEIYLGCPLLTAKTELEMIDRIIDLLGTPNGLEHLPLFRNGTVEFQRMKRNHLWDKFGSLPTEGLALLSNLLQYDPKIRWTAREAEDSQYFTTSPLPATRMPKFTI